MLRRIHYTIRWIAMYAKHHLAPRQFLIFACIIVGLSSGLAAVALKYVVHLIGSSVEKYSEQHFTFWAFAFLPLAGILLTVFYIRRFLKGDFKKGSAEIQYAIAKDSSRLPAKQMYYHMITSALTVGLGGSTGLESPLISTGAAIGSNFASTYQLSYKERTILLACGASASIAAAFNSPIAGVLFAIEVVLADISLSAFIPLIIAAASGALLSRIILKEGVILNFTLKQPFNYSNVPFYIILGILAGFLSLYYARVFEWIGRKMQLVKNPWTRVFAGGILLALLLLFFPPLFGEGYTTITILASLHPENLVTSSVLHSWLHTDWPLLVFLGMVMLFKVVAAGITLGSGGNGGNFGPSLFIGAYLGFTFARVINLTGIATIPEVNFTLVAMAGVLSGVFYAPLSAIFLIAEITGGYELMIPLMIVSAMSLTIAKYFEPLSMEAKKLSAKLKHNIDDRDKFLLSKMELNTLIETSFSEVKPEDSLHDLVNIISTSHRNTFPVVNDEKKLVGLIHLDNVRSTIFHTELYDSVFVKDIMTAPEAIISPNESLHEILKKFEDTHQWNLPVVENDHYAGFVSKASILSKYRMELLNTV